MKDGREREGRHSRLWLRQAWVSVTQFPHVRDEDSASDSISLRGLLGRLNGVMHGKQLSTVSSMEKSPQNTRAIIPESTFSLMFFWGNWLEMRLSG